MRRYNALMLAGVVTLCLNVGVQGEPSEPADPPKRTYVPTVFFDHGAEFPPLYRPAAEVKPNSLSGLPETLFGTYSFREKDTVYNIEFYYRKFFERMRLRVLVGQRELHGPFNRLYGIDPGREIMFWVSQWEGGSIELTFNFAILKLEESSIDTDAIYDTIEAFLSRSGQPDPRPTIRLWGTPGLLKKTCWVQISARSCGGQYLINERGQVDPLTLENLRFAYNREQITAQRLADYERIGRSLIVAENDAISQGKIIVISRVEDIPGYPSHPLDAQNEAQIKVPAVRTDADAKIDYWTCFTYRARGGVVARYTFGFENGKLRSAEKALVSEWIGGAYRLAGDGLSQIGDPRAGSAVGGSWQAPTRDTPARTMRNTTRTSLHQAARENDLARVRSLIVSGSPVNAKEDYGYTPLHYAALAGHKDVVELLLAHGADIGAPTWVADTPLHCAAERGHIAIAELLIAKGADVNAKGNHGRTPLHHAARLANRQLVELLVAKGADVNARDKSDCLPLHGAAQQNATDIAEILIGRGTNVSARDNSGLTPLHIAAEGGHKAMVEFLIVRGADVNALAGNGTPLHAAVEGGHKNVVELLLAKGADVTIRNEARETVIDLARRHKQTEILEILTATK